MFVLFMHASVFIVLQAEWGRPSFIPFLPCMCPTSSSMACILTCSFFIWQYGDSYTEDVTEDSLRETFKNIQDQVLFIGSMYP